MEFEDRKGRKDMLGLQGRAQRKCQLKCAGRGGIYLIYKYFF